MSTRRSILPVTVPIALALMLGGCAQPKSSVWATNYAPTPGVSMPATTQTKIIPAPYDQLDEDASIDGWTIVGTARFRDEKIPSEAMGVGSPLDEQARGVGADLVRIGIRPAGTEERTRMIRSRSPAPVPDQATRSGRPVGGSGEHVEPVQVPVEVFDYLAIFYHKDS